MFRRLLGYAAYMFMTGALTSLLSFAVDAFGMVTRPKESYGDYHIYVLILNIGVGLFISGPNGAIQKFGANNEAQRKALASLILKIFVVLLIVTSVIGLVVGIAYRWNIALSFFGVPWLVVFWMSRYIARSQLKAKYEGWLLATGSLSKTIFIGAFLGLSEHPDAMIFGDVIALFVAGLISLYVLRLSMEAPLSELFRVPIPRSFMREFLVFVRPLWIGGQVFLASQEFMGLFTTTVPWLGRTAMASMGVLRTFWQITFKPMDFISQAALPTLIIDEGGRKKLYEDLLRLSLIVFSGLGLVTAGAGGLLLELFSIRQKYVEVPALMIIQAAVVPIYVVHMTMSQYTIAEDFPKYTLYANIASIVGNAASVYPLSIYFGLNGVVVSAAIGFLLSASTFLYCLRKTHPEEVRVSIQSGIRMFLVLILALAPVYYFRWSENNWRLIFPSLLIFIVLTRIFQFWAFSDLKKGYQLVKTAITDRGQKPESSTPST